MKINRLLLCLAGLFLAASFTSCNKDDYEPSENKFLPARIDYAWVHPDPVVGEISSFTMRIDYDERNRMSGMRLDFIAVGETTERAIIYTFSYDGNDMTIVTDPQFDTSYDTWTANYRRVGNQILPVDDQGGFAIDSRLRSTDYQYDGKDNVMIDGGGLLEYDKENGVFRYVNMPSWYLTKAFGPAIGKRNLYNNCVKETLKSGVVYEFTNTYNADNYSTHIQIAQSSGSAPVENYTIEYIRAK